VKDTREKILEAAFAMMLKNGVNGVSTGDIAKALGVARSLPYRYFATKRELVLESFKLFFCDRFFCPEAPLDGSMFSIIEFSEKTFRDIIESSGKIIGEKIDVFAYNTLYIEALNHEPEFRRYTVMRSKLYKKCIADAVKNGELKDVDAEFVMRSFLDIFGRACDIVTERSSKRNLENIIGDMWRFYSLIKKA